jgi:hypothetical protein
MMHYAEDEALKYDVKRQMRCGLDIVCLKMQYSSFNFEFVAVFLFVCIE